MTFRRKTVFRILAIGLGLCVFLLAEVACRVTGLGQQPAAGNAFVEFDSVRPLFQKSADGQCFETAENRREFFAAESFGSVKGPTERRIFIFGGSTVQGRPFSVPTAFSTWLEIALNVVDRQHRWQVVNCGGISYASYRLLPVMQECLAYEPDIYVVCTGHNEFLECITYAPVRRSLPAVRYTHQLASRLYCFRALQSLLTTSADHKSQPEKSRPALSLPAEVDAMLDHQGGLQAYNRAALQREVVESAFEDNLERMADLCRSHDVPLVMLAPPSNLADCPPFKSQFSEQVSEATQKRVAGLLKKANAAMTQRPEIAVPLLQQATELDPHYAISWYQLGRALVNSGRYEVAAAALQRACDEDVCPLRMTSALKERLVKVCRRRDVPLLDLVEVLKPYCRHKLIGDAVLVDHVHPSFRSNQRIAFRILQLLQQHGLTSGKAADEQQLLPAFAAHFESLDDLYFLRGRRTLTLLQAWTQGRADGPPLPTAAPTSETVD